jgi:hypothetical protein
MRIGETELAMCITTVRNECELLTALDRPTLADE